MYGKGCYFGNTADVAHRFATASYHPNAPQGVFSVLLCKLITGLWHVGNSTTVQPNSGYDSTRNDDGTYYVIYNPACILPVAIIEYTVNLRLH